MAPHHTTYPAGHHQALPPAAYGFRMPAEWERHRGTWLSWPHRESSWPGNFGPIPAVFAEIVRHLVSGEEVHVNVVDRSMAESAREALRRAGVGEDNVFFHHIPTNDAWCRDHGPIFVQRETTAGPEQIILDWGYNAWGGKYPPFEEDDAVPTRVAADLGLPVVYPGIIMEGGSLDVNGAGTLLTTEACLLNPNRNPGLGTGDLERILKDHLGVIQVLWLGDGIEGDDTDGHVDDLSRFVSPTTIVTVREQDPLDANYAPLEENYRRLLAMRTPSGAPFEILSLPMPKPIWYEGQRLPASYANFYIGNEVVLLPGYDAATTDEARRILQSCFPARRVVPIDCTDLIWGLGALHCVTQQWPAV